MGEVEEESEGVNFKFKSTLNHEFTVEEERKSSEIIRRSLNFFVFLFSSLFFIIFIFGSYDFSRNVEENKCSMTYMFEYPHYKKIDIGIYLAHKFPNYALYFYSEGKHYESKNKFSGIPVLYIPGNAGSYKQVRSFASVALRKWLGSRSPFHFDFFSLDYNEELSGLYGYSLQKQSQFLNETISKIRGFYDQNHSPLLIGHSMGGIIAKSLDDNELVSLIMTLASPHESPPIILDPEFDLFYYSLAASSWKNTTILSIGGGERDLLINSKLTKWTLSQHFTHSLSSGVPGVWSSTDHLCVVWCKELVLSLVRSLFDLVEFNKIGKYYALTSNSQAHSAVLNYHFKKRSSGKSFHTAHPEEEIGKPGGEVEWNEINLKYYCPPKIDKYIYIMVPLSNLLSKNQQILVQTTNTKAKNWIFGCREQQIENNIRYCSQMDNLSNETEIVPSFHRRKKIIHLDGGITKKYSHLVIKMSPVPFRTCFEMDVYDSKERTKLIGDSFNTVPTSIFYNLTFPTRSNLSKIISWAILATPQDGKCSGHYNSIGIFKNGNFQTHNFFKNESLLVRFTDSSSPAHALLYLDRECNYNITVKFEWMRTCGHLFRTYVKMFPSYLTSIVLMSFYFQKDDKNWKNFHLLLLQNACYLTIVPGFIVGFCIALLPTDYRVMLSGGEYFPFLPLFLYLSTFPLLLLISSSLWILIICNGRSLSYISSKLIKIPGGNMVEDGVLNLTLDKIPLSIAILIICLGISTSGSLSILITLLIYSLKIFRGYEGLLEELLLNKKVSESKINFHIHSLLLWLIVSALQLPSLLAYLKDFKSEEGVRWDLSLYVCLMLSPSIGILWQTHTPHFHPSLWKLQRCICYCMGLVGVLWASFRLYLLSFIILLVLDGISILQLLSLLIPTVN